VNTLRFFDAIDFTSGAETRLQDYNPVVTAADTVMKR